VCQPFFRNGVDPVEPAANRAEARNHGEQALDESALNRFLAGVEKRAFRMAQLATGDVDEALDLVQEAMLTLARRYARRPEAEWAPLFHRILQNRIRDWYRRRKVRNGLMAWLRRDDPDAAADPLENLPTAENRGPAAQADNLALHDRLARALSELPLRQQQTFLLRVWEGLDVKDTARAMGISSGSVKTHYSRAVHALREKLGDFHHE